MEAIVAQMTMPVLIAAVCLPLVHLVLYRFQRPGKLEGVFRWLGDACLLLSRLLIGGYFVAAACLKLMDPVAFAQQVFYFNLIPAPAAVVVGVLLPYVELLAGCAVVLGVRGRAGSLVLTVLLTVFTGAIILAIFQGIDISCGCLGKHDASRTNWKKVASNMALFFPALHVLLIGPGRLAFDAALSRVMSPGACRQETTCEMHRA